MGDAALTIMIIDDDRAVLESFCDYFQDHGFRTLPVASGEAALASFDAEAPDAAIVDIRMGGMTGDDFIRQAGMRQSGCAFVICTGSPDYSIPNGIRGLRGVSPTVFRKPVADLGLLEREILRLVRDKDKHRIGDE